MEWKFAIGQTVTLASALEQPRLRNLPRLTILERLAREMGAGMELSYSCRLLLNADLSIGVDLQPAHFDEAELAAWPTSAGS